MKCKQSAVVILSLMMAIAACNSGSNSGAESGTTTETENAASAGEAASPKGIGPYQNVQLTNPLDETMIAAGKSSYEVKCQSCHKLTDERLVGPGWKGVTDRRTPEWIMNFIVNVDEMIDKDPAGQKMLEECLVRMPNQNLSESEARSLLEFMRKNDEKS